MCFFKFLAAPIKPSAGASLKKSLANSKLPTNKPASIASSTANPGVTDKTSKKPSVESTSATQSMKIGDKMVEVKQIRMTKAQIEDMKKQGKIKMKDGRLCIFKK